MQKLSRLTAVIAAALLLFSACAGGSGEPIPVQPAGHSAEPSDLARETAPQPTEQPGVTFVNGLASATAELYISPSAASEWGEACGFAVPAGEALSVGAELLSGIPAVFDIGVLDENGINYDAFGVALASGDELLLTGDYANGIFTVTKMDGSRDFYNASVRYSAPDPAPERISVNTRTERFIVQNGERSIAVDRSVLALSAEDAQRFPGLAAALSELNAARMEALTSLAERYAETAAVTACPGETPDGGEDGSGEQGSGAYSGPIREDAVVFRSDTALVSILFEVTGGAGTSYACASFDSEGNRLFLSDIVNDVRLLPHLANVSLAEQGSELELNEYRDHTADFSADSRHYAFAVSESELIICFNENAFKSGVGAVSRAVIPLETNEFLLRPAFTLQP